MKRENSLPEPRVRVELLGGARLPGSRILDGLRLVQYHEMPRDRRQPRHAQERSVARDDEIHVRDPFLIERL